MSIYYTTQEGGDILRLNYHGKHSFITKQLYRHRKPINDERVQLRFGSHYTIVKIPGSMSRRVHSVFFTKNGGVTRIWDAHLNGYRPKRFTKGLKLTK